MMPFTQSGLVPLVICILVFWPGFLLAARPQCNLSYSIEQFPIAEKKITVEVVKPSTGNYPAILFIHGTAGLLTRPQGAEALPVEENFGEYDAACHGYVVVMVHYLEVSGIFHADDLNVIHLNSRLWLDTLRQAISFVKQLPGLDRRAKVGVLGESLGAYLGLALASSDQRIGAVSEVSGGIPDQWFDHPDRLPPVLIQHGEADSIVPVEEALKLEALLKSKGVAYGVHIYPGLHHIFPSSAHKQSLEFSLTFFDKYLKHIPNE